MKKLFLILAASLTTLAASSQTKELDNLNKRLQKSEEAIADPKKSGQASTWLEYSDAMLAASNAYTSNLIAGFSIEQTLTILAQRPSTIEEVEIADTPYKKYVFDNFDIYVDQNGQTAFWQTRNEFRPNALEESYNALKKAGEIDPSVYSGRGYMTANNLLNQYNTNGMNLYNIGDKRGAAEMFAKTVEVNGLLGEVDSMMIYYTGVAYYEAQDYDKALEQLNKALEIGYDQEGTVYSYISFIHEQQGNKDAAIAAIEQAVEQYPEDTQLMTQLIGMYLDAERDPQTIVAMLDKAKAQDADNINLYLVEGSLWEQMGDSDKAEQIFAQVIEKDPTNFVGYLNTGILRARKGDALVEKANLLDINDVTGYNALIEEAYPHYTGAIELLEKAHEIDPQQDRVIELLKELYYRRIDDDPKNEERFNYFDNLYKSMYE